MVNLIDNQQKEEISGSTKHKFFVIILILLAVDTFLVKRDGDYIIIGDTALEVFDVVMLFFFAIAIIALMRPMDHKMYQK